MFEVVLVEWESLECSFILRESIFSILFRKKIKFSQTITHFILSQQAMI